VGKKEGVNSILQSEKLIKVYPHVDQCRSIINLHRSTAVHDTHTLRDNIGKYNIANNNSYIFLSKISSLLELFFPLLA
jgi:hypothetical protein